MSQILTDLDLDLDLDQDKPTNMRHKSTFMQVGVGIMKWWEEELVGGFSYWPERRVNEKNKKNKEFNEIIDHDT